MAYDEARGQVVLFGGWNRTYLGDTWVWDGEAWTERKVPGPSARGGRPGFAYDPADELLLLYGGGDAGGWLADMWSWDGERWVELGPP